VCLIDWSIRATDLAIVFATIAGPILAVWASERRQARKGLHDRKEWVFRTLWSTRSANLHPDHVSALNHIDFAFPENDYPKIGDAWHLYQAHLNTDQGQTQDSIARWNEKASSLLADVIHLMASDLGIPFSKSLVAQRSYYPIAYATNEARQRDIQSALLDVLRNQHPITVRAMKDNAP